MQYPAMVRYCGQLYPPDRELLEGLIARDRVPLEAQPALWMDFARDWPVASWIQTCHAQARLLIALGNESREISAMINSASSVEVAARPVGGTAQRHFLWHGDRLGIPAEVLRGGIRNLALKGLIRNSEEQRRALRLGLGLALNADERTAEPQWVVWLGHDDMLRHLVDTLWELDIIGCAGGRREKWNTLCGLFIRPDGTHFERKIKTDYCTNPRKLRILEEAILGSLRPFAKAKP